MFFPKSLTLHPRRPMPTQDEKIMRFLENIPREWRLFWTMEAFFLSFWLALVGVFKVGNSQPISPDAVLFANGIDIIPPYFMWVFAPGTLTMWALVINASVKRTAEACSGVEERPNMESLTGEQCGNGTLLCSIREIPWFAMAMLIWFVVSAVVGVSGTLWVLSGKYLEFVVLSGVIMLILFVLGLVKLSLCACKPHPRPPLPRWCPLYVGSGIGAFIGGTLVASISNYQWISLVGGLIAFLMGFFLYAEPDFFGTWVEKRIKKAVGVIQRSDGVIHWIIASCVQLLVVSWTTEVGIFFWFRILG